MIYKWSHYFGLSLGLHWLELFLSYDHMSVKKLDLNVENIMGIFETNEKEMKNVNLKFSLFL